MPAIATQVSRKRTPRTLSTQRSLAIFSTEIGWFGLLGSREGICRLTFGHTNPQAVRTALELDDTEDRDWSPSLRHKLELYATGYKVDFTTVQVIRSRPLTAFQQRVIEIVRAIPRGKTLTYGEVAALAGSSGAARAVGTVMSTNPVPLIVPCHRVVGSAGSLGGFSAAGGVRTKRWMLDLESGKLGDETQV